MTTAPKSTATGANTITLPTGIVAGDRLFAFVSCYATAGSLPSTPAGWTMLFNDTTSGFTSGSTNNSWGALYTKVAAGTESGTTITVGTHPNNVSVALVYAGDPGYTTPTVTHSNGDTVSISSVAGTTTPSLSTHLLFYAGTNTSGTASTISATGYTVGPNNSNAFYAASVLTKNTDDPSNTSGTVLVNSSQTTSMIIATVQIINVTTVSGAAALTNGTSSLSATGVIAKVGTVSLTNGAATLTTSGTVVPGTSATLTNGAAILTVSAFRGQFATANLTNGISTLTVTGSIAKEGVVALTNGPAALAVAVKLNQFAVIALTNGPATLIAMGIRTIVTLWTAVTGSSSTWTERVKTNSTWTESVKTPTAWSG